MELSELNLTDEQLQGVQKILQSETDKVRTKYSTELKNMKSNEDYSKLENTYKELDGKYTTLTNELMELRQYKQEQETKNKQEEIKKTLENNGLNGELIKYLNVEGVEDLESYISNLQNVLSVGGTNGTQSYVPKAHNQGSQLSKEDFQKMNYMDRVNLYNTNKTLYDALSK